jgi:LysM repeat protein
MKAAKLLLIGIILCLVLSGCALGIESSAGPVPLSTAVVPTLPATATATIAPTAVPPTNTPTETPVFTLADATTATATPQPFIEHIVQPGETLDIIAAQYDTTSQLIVIANSLSDPDQITISQTLSIPPPGYSVADFAVVEAPASKHATTIGYSVRGRPIEAYTFGDGPNTLIFVGAHHGGYEWNTAVLAYEVIDYLEANPGVVPVAVTAHIIPAANPDGIYEVTGKVGRFRATDVFDIDTFSARFNANNVDLNRNWDCDWTANAFWRDQPVSGGSEPFSEVENQVLRDFITQQEQVEVVVFWHSQATLVSPGNCDARHQPSIDMATTYARAANYPVQEFSAYEITGDASNWLAKEGVPSFSVELTDHETTDWNQNRAGVLALLNLYKE